MRRQWTCKRWWGRWVCEQWRQILMQQSKQNMFFSFLLAHSWTTQGLKNFSARRIWSQRGIIDGDELIPTWSTYQKKQQTQLLINEIKENSKKALCVCVHIHHVELLMIDWYRRQLGVCELWLWEWETYYQSLLQAATLYLSTFFLVVRQCRWAPHHLTPFSRALALV